MEKHLNEMSTEEARSKLDEIQQRRREQMRNMSLLNHKTSIQRSKTYLNAICYEYTDKDVTNERVQAKAMSYLLGLDRKCWKQDYSVLERLPPNEYLTDDDRCIIKAFMAWTPLERTDSDQICRTEGLADAMRSIRLMKHGGVNMAKRLNPQNLPHAIKNDHELFTFFGLCYRDGASEYEEAFHHRWGKQVIICSYLAPVIADFSSADDSADDSGDEPSSGQDMSASDSQSSSEGRDGDDSDDADDEDSYDLQDGFINDADEPEPGQEESPRATCSAVVDGGCALGGATTRSEAAPAAAQQAQPRHALESTGDGAAADSEEGHGAVVRGAFSLPGVAPLPAADPADDAEAGSGRDAAAYTIEPRTGSAEGAGRHGRGAEAGSGDGSSGLGRRRKRARDDGSALSPEAHAASGGCDGGSRDAGAEMGWSPSRGAQVMDLTMDDSGPDDDAPPPAHGSQPPTPWKLPACARI